MFLSDVLKSALKLNFVYRYTSNKQQLEHWRGYTPQLLHKSTVLSPHCIGMWLDPRLCNQASFDVLLHFHLNWSREVLPNWLIPLFFSLDAQCAAGELDIVSQHCWFACVSAKRLFSTIQSQLCNWCALSYPLRSVLTLWATLGATAAPWELVGLLGDWGKKPRLLSLSLTVCPTGPTRVCLTFSRRCSPFPSFQQCFEGWGSGFYKYNSVY